jgi:hypothetical protein
MAHDCAGPPLLTGVTIGMAAPAVNWKLPGG